MKEKNSAQSSEDMASKEYAPPRLAYSRVVHAYLLSGFERLQVLLKRYNRSGNDITGRMIPSQPVQRLLRREKLLVQNTYLVGVGVGSRNGCLLP